VGYVLKVVVMKTSIEYRGVKLGPTVGDTFLLVYLCCVWYNSQFSNL
jgi:hypothetical protein